MTTLLALALGILAGLFFGERVAFLRPAADAYVLLLQMTVIPYLAASLMISVGGLSRQEATALAVRGVGMLLLIYALVFGYLVLVPLAYPSMTAGAFFSASLTEQAASVDYVDLFIPSNPFQALAASKVPAVVVFSIFVGVALIGSGTGEPLLKVLVAVRDVMAKVTATLAKAMPVGVFLIATHTAGTLRIEELQRLQVHLLTTLLMLLFFALWVLPGLVSALTDIRYRDVLRVSRDTLASALAVGELMVVLPLIFANGRELLARGGLRNEKSEAVLDAAIPASFNFPHTAKLGSLLFIMFSGWFTGHPVAPAEYPVLFASGAAALFGGVNVAVPFLLNLFRLPADMFQLYLASGVLLGKVAALVSAMHTLAVGLLVSAAVTGQLRFRSLRLLRFVGVTGLLTVFTLGAAGRYLASQIERQRPGQSVLQAMRLPPAAVQATVHLEPPADQPRDPAELKKLAAIRRRGVLRVGYLGDNVPYAYFNGTGELVGFDIEMAHALAEDLGVRLELVPVTRRTMAEQLDAGLCDVVMSGIVETIERREQLNFSASYLSETAAFVVLDFRRDEIAAPEARGAAGAIRVADFTGGDPGYERTVRRYFPDATLVPVRTVDDFFEDRTSRFDTILLSAERGSAWSLLHPDFTVVVPRANELRTPLAYAGSYRDPEFVDLVSAWVAIKKSDGTVAHLYDRWILGKDAVPHQPRWSILDAILRRTTGRD